ncbi:MAG TPA: helix-turn-helix domain-containing protein [Acetobacteraceae bacterium]|jgi:AraC-like DNA-binding protein|nr:helix-turn-helix domain-containing protein [Acetobacteraceae bacterium]
MPASGFSIFTDADGYRNSLQDMLDLVVLQPRDFQARLTWVELENLRLLRAYETSPRVAYMTLPSNLVFVTFATRQGGTLIHAGAPTRFGDLNFHRRGGHGHQRTTAASHWGSVALTPSCLMAFGRAICGQALVAPSVDQVVRPRRADWQRFLRLHAQAGRIAESSLGRILHKEVARALEQDLIWALVNCLTAGTVQTVPDVTQRQASISVPLETMLAAHPGRPLRVREACRATGVSQRTLRASCLALLGMGLGDYQRLRRLKLARVELTKAATVDSLEVVKRYGFADLHRFVTDYWNAYGEMPPIPPRAAADRCM